MKKRVEPNTIPCPALTDSEEEGNEWKKRTEQDADCPLLTDSEDVPQLSDEEDESEKVLLLLYSRHIIYALFV